jgi:hypothetical protein
MASFVFMRLIELPAKAILTAGSYMYMSKSPQIIILHFQFRRLPFALCPWPAFLYLAESMP